MTERAKRVPAGHINLFSVLCRHRELNCYQPSSDEEQGCTQHGFQWQTIMPRHQPPSSSLCPGDAHPPIPFPCMSSYCPLLPSPLAVIISARRHIIRSPCSQPGLPVSLPLDNIQVQYTPETLERGCHVLGVPLALLSALMD